MMMSYGQFVFGLSTAAYDELQRQTAWRHPTSDRVGARPAHQYLGPGDDTIRLRGELLPHFTGGQQNLDELRAMAEKGNAWPLIEGTGHNYGVYVISRLNETHDHFFHDGAAAHIRFDLALERVDDDQAQARIGKLTADDIDQLALGSANRRIG
ncbi:phage tail protein [Salinisphaera sp. USBA-960]|nr:phage tail protein [Salifodinibacter halophilus]NNC25291.1 phage tail protein [Salifodinibacter halophilus]